MQNTSTTTGTTLKTVSRRAPSSPTQQVANLVGRNWRFINQSAARWQVHRPGGEAEGHRRVPA